MPRTFFFFFFSRFSSLPDAQQLSTTLSAHQSNPRSKNICLLSVLFQTIPSHQSSLYTPTATTRLPLSHAGTPYQYVATSLLISGPGFQFGVESCRFTMVDWGLWVNGWKFADHWWKVVPVVALVGPQKICLECHALHGVVLSLWKKDSQISLWTRPFFSWPVSIYSTVIIARPPYTFCRLEKKI